jgi:phosphoglycerate dehydrogenase-like enzyme
MRVTVVREHSEQPSPPAKQVFGFDQMQAAVAQADFVVLAIPVTPETTGFFNARLFAAMKQSAYLVNVGRGVLVDEAAMIEVLQQKRIAGAALDVFTEEPLPANSPLWEMENVMITPHTASITERLWERHYELISENVRRYLSSAPLLGVVNKAKGY